MNRFRHNDQLASSRAFRLTVIVILAISLPLFFISWNVRIVTNAQTFYEWGFDNYNVQRTTGLDEAALSSAAEQLINYFNNDEEFLDIRVNYLGGEIELFSQREITHMSDVKDVINAVFTGGWITGGVLIVVVSGGFFLLGRRFLPLLRAGIVWSTITGLTIAALFGIATLIDFNTTFRLFHEVTFRNDFWKLSPSQSVLLRMFPQGFWLTATLMLVVATALQFGVVYGAATWAWRRFGDEGASAAAQPALDSSGSAAEPLI